MDLISREKAIVQLSHNKSGNDDSDVVVQHDIETVKGLPSAFEGMTNNEVHKAMFGFELNPRYLVTDDNCIVGGEDCPACPLYNKICNNRNFAEWLDSPYKGVSE